MHGGMQMMKMLNRIILFIALAICSLSPVNAQSPSTSVPLPKLDKRATLSDSLQWTLDAIYTYASVGVYGQKDGYFKPGFAFHKGFKLDHADGCILYLKNEGIFESNQNPYLCEVTIPVADLDSSSGTLHPFHTGKPDLDKLYGTWRLDFKTKDQKATARMYMKESPLGDFRGSVVSFTFVDKAVAKTFDEGFKQVIRMCQKK